MRRFALPMAAVSAAVVALAAGPATMAAAGTAGTHVLAVSHGCPGGDVCLYGSQSAFKKDKPTVTDTDVPGLFDQGIAHNAVVVNNSSKYYATEGSFYERYFKGIYFCYYTADPKDEQDPNRIENPADGDSVQAIETATTKIVTIPVSMSYCDG
jgi:hypothetical protein